MAKQQLSVFDVDPVGVWRTTQTYDDYLNCMASEVADPDDHQGRRSCNGLLVSACLIVRDEEENIASCLGSIKDVADEIIVVDTGSRDRTPHIAETYGAKLIHAPWTDDFSKARNLAQKHASGKWILAIDADETLQPVRREGLWALLEDDAVGGYYVLMQRRKILTPNWQMKLYLRAMGLQHGPLIHEGITPASVRRVTGRNLRRCKLLFKHTGYEGDLSRKHDRNHQLLIREIKRDPDTLGKVFIWGHLGDIYAAWGDARSAERAWHRAMSILRREERLHPVHCAPFLALASHVVALGRDAGPLLAEIQQRFPGNLQTFWIQIQRHMRLGEFRRAITLCEHLTADETMEKLEHWVGYDRRLFRELPDQLIKICVDRLRDKVYLDQGK